MLMGMMQKAFLCRPTVCITEPASIFLRVLYKEWKGVCWGSGLEIRHSWRWNGKISTSHVSGSWKYILLPIILSSEVVIHILGWSVLFTNATIWMDKKTLLQLHLYIWLGCDDSMLLWYWWDLDNPKHKRRPWGEETCIPVLVLFSACSMISGHLIPFCPWFLL